MAKFQCNFISYTLSRAVDITVIIPSLTFPDIFDEKKTKVIKHKKDHPYPVLYLLHGGGNNHATWGGYTNIELYAEEQQVAVVMLSTENKSFISLTGDDFFTFVSNELPDFVSGMFPISNDPEHTYIAGLSMGGFGTLVHSLTFPERFKAAGALSAAVDVNMLVQPLPGAEKPAASLLDQYSPILLAKKIKEEGRNFTKYYIACGEKDFLFEDNLKFRDELKGLGADITWVQHPDFSHEWRFWDWQVEEFLKWIPRSDFYKGEPRQV